MQWVEGYTTCQAKILHQGLLWSCYLAGQLHDGDVGLKTMSWEVVEP